MQDSDTGQLTRKELEELKRLKAVREALDEFKRRGISADIAVCPNCKSPRLVDLTSFHDLGYIGSFQPAYYCLDCGWYGRSITIMSNRPERDVVLEDMKSAFGSLREPEGTEIEDTPAEEDL
ncbi:MAG: hypothetical protein JSW61_00725 [Candidatus Thorarchaeota archaeon]|nr:MAG: hypothetical protein JSW61_00725 [Candidatus Thorarchaeota archaeon]